MIVNDETNASYSCYQLNRVRKVSSFVKDYKWDGEEMVPTGKYCKIYSNERIMIPNHRDRIVYLCNYILKNFYRTNKWSLVGEWTRKGMTEQAKESHELWKIKNPERCRLPFDETPEDDKFFSSTDDVQVIINGHRYNLS